MAYVHSFPSQPVLEILFESKVFRALTDRARVAYEVLQRVVLASLGLIDRS